MKLITKLPLLGSSLGQTRNTFLAISLFLYIRIIHLILEQLQWKGTALFCN